MHPEFTSAYEGSACKGDYNKALLRKHFINTCIKFNLSVKKKKEEEKGKKRKVGM